MSLEPVKNALGDVIGYFLDNGDHIVSYGGDKRIISSHKSIAAAVAFLKNCQHCRNEPERGWIEQDNNGPIVPCPVCNPRGQYAL